MCYKPSIVLYCIVLYCNISIHLYSASSSAHQSEALQCKSPREKRAVFNQSSILPGRVVFVMAFSGISTHPVSLVTEDNALLTSKQYSSAVSTFFSRTC